MGLGSGRLAVRFAGADDSEASAAGTFEASVVRGFEDSVVEALVAGWLEPLSAPVELVEAVIASNGISVGFEDVITESDMVERNRWRLRWSMDQSQT